jgi:hypothetical protein
MPNNTTGHVLLTSPGKHFKQQFQCTTFPMKIEPISTMDDRQIAVHTKAEITKIHQDKLI